MQALLDELLAFPTVIFTVIAGLTTLYWLFVSVTGFDVFEGAEGAVDGALEGATESVGEGLFEGAADALEGAADAVDALDSTQVGAGTVLHALNLRDIPTTMALSIVSLVSWLLCALGMRYLAPLAPDAVPDWAIGLLIAGAALALSLPLSGAIARPLSPLFRTQEADRNVSMVGQSATVRSATIPPGATGQVEFETGGASRLLDVRSDAVATLRRGDAVLLVDYDPNTTTYAIEPMDRLLTRSDDSDADDESDDALEDAIAEVSAVHGGGTTM